MRYVSFVVQFLCFGRETKRAELEAEQGAFLVIFPLDSRHWNFHVEREKAQTSTDLLLNFI